MVLMVEHTSIQSSALHGGAFSRSSSTTRQRCKVSLAFLCSCCALLLPAALKRVMNNVEGEQQHQRSAGNVWRACLQRASLSALAA